MKCHAGRDGRDVLGALRNRGLLGDWREQPGARLQSGDRKVLEMTRLFRRDSLQRLVLGPGVTPAPFCDRCAMADGFRVHEYWLQTAGNDLPSDP